MRKFTLSRGWIDTCVPVFVSLSLGHEKRKEKRRMSGIIGYV